MRASNVLRRITTQALHRLQGVETVRLQEVTPAANSMFPKPINTKGTCASNSYSDASRSRQGALKDCACAVLTCPGPTCR